MIVGTHVDLYEKISEDAHFAYLVITIYISGLTQIIRFLKYRKKISVI